MMTRMIKIMVNIDRGQDDNKDDDEDDDQDDQDEDDGECRPGECLTVAPLNFTRLFINCPILHKTKLLPFWLMTTQNIVLHSFFQHRFLEFRFCNCERQQ